MTPKEYADRYEELQGKVDYMNSFYEDLLSLDDDYIYSLEQRIAKLEDELQNCIEQQAGEDL